MASPFASGLGFDVLPVMVVFMIAVVSMVMVVPAMVLIPVVIVFNTAALSFPIPGIIPFSVVSWRNPTSPFVGRLSPIAFMPLVVISHGIPISLNPNVIRRRPCLHNHNRPRRRWRRNYNSNGNLRVSYRSRA